MEEDEAPSRKSSSPDHSTHMETARSSSSSSIARPAAIERGGKGGREEGEARGGEGGAVSPSPAPVATPPQYRMDEAIVRAAEANNLARVMELHTEGITLDSVDRVRTAITTPTISLN